PVITATQMLESMTGKPRPTRAEASDVANAIFDGTDAIMLSGETANGEYPIEAVKMMDKIALKVEESIDYHHSISEDMGESHMAIHNAIGYAASSITENINASHIFTFSYSGFSARNVSKFRPFAPIVAITPNEVTYYQLSLIWGVIPLIIPKTEDQIELYTKAIEAAQEEIGLSNGSSIVIVSGMPLNTPKTTNNIRIHVVGKKF
ncbi:MAG: pyruvate kinase, partial [Defluviitaleaceae bacterium]|nr:pyruvate kinase [Defluviitaleaceae bacterium]